VPSERCSIEDDQQNNVDGRVVSSDVVRGDLRSPYIINKLND
jgi:hypothetical protein